MVSIKYKITLLKIIKKIIKNNKIEKSVLT